MKRLTNKQISSIIELYISGKSPKEIGMKFDIHNNSITRILRRHNIERNQKININDETEKYICKQYLAGKNSEIIAEELSIHPTTVCRVIKRNGLKIRPGHENKRKYKLNITWLDNIDCQEKAYFLGLFWADGNVSKRGNSLSLRLHSKDKNVLVRLSHFFYDTDRVSDYVEDTNKVSTPVSKLCIYSKHMKNRMLKMGCVPNKSKIIKFPPNSVINNKMLPHFIRGLMDGDGCICIRSNGRITVDLTGNEYITHSLKNILGNRSIFSSLFYSKKKDSWSLQINKKKDIILFLDWIYKNSNLHMRRKYNKYIKIKL